MKAAVYHRYGPPEVLSIEEIAAPEIQAEGHEDRVLIEVHAAAMNPFDVLHRSGFLPVRPSAGWFAPKYPVLGIDVAGTVAAVGKNVTRMQVGDAVYGICLGTHAGFVRAHERTVAKMPANLTFTQAAAIPTAALTALQGLRDFGQVVAGQNVLINGASGGVGHFAVQIAKSFGAQVTAVTSTPNLEWMPALGADRWIDYTREDFTRSGPKYDLIYDAVAKRRYFECKPALTPSGLYLTENSLKPKFQFFQVIFSLLRGDQRVRTHMARPNAEDLDFLRSLVEDGKLKPVIGKVYPLDEIVAAHRHLEGGHARGKIVIQVAD
ncbi:NADPH:quinone reductase [Longilinea arvoryzae]|uniref:NADPH:quinone reductase n=1 Tax=Longilinea arvoryzae TaxID=360412 RepID=A0A0K8MXQ0_9CHLR|nr:NAD(P)-dependent alcohol dehydrogenase [Longilinea arvoryzae]GAP15980.1 NADPH:quinone reductase [Longilinea arvoryzae]